MNEGRAWVDELANPYLVFISFLQQLRPHHTSVWSHSLVARTSACRPCYRRCGLVTREPPSVATSRTAPPRPDAGKRDGLWSTIWCCMSLRDMKWVSFKWGLCRCGVSEIMTSKMWWLVQLQLMIFNPCYSSAPLYSGHFLIPNSVHIDSSTIEPIALHIILVSNFTLPWSILYLISGGGFGASYRVAMKNP